MVKKESWTKKQLYITGVIALAALAVGFIVPNAVKNSYQENGDLKGELFSEGVSSYPPGFDDCMYRTNDYNYCVKYFYCMQDMSVSGSLDLLENYPPCNNCTLDDVFDLSNFNCTYEEYMGKLRRFCHCQAIPGCEPTEASCEDDPTFGESICIEVCRIVCVPRGDYVSSSGGSSSYN